jgi:hypothetical protein
VIESQGDLAVIARSLYYVESTLTIEYRILRTNIKSEAGQAGKGHMVDALASRAEEGRGKTAKSLGELSSKLSRGFPNGATRPGKPWALLAEHIG